MAVTNEGSNIDIQDAFDALNSCEQEFIQKGYQEGFQNGEDIGYQEGFDLGVQKGRKIGFEICFYRGFAKGFIAQLDGGTAFTDALNDQLKSNPKFIDPQTVSTLQDLVTGSQDRSENNKLIKTLQKLLDKVNDFPTENVKNQDFVDKLRDIRAKFKHCCSLLKLDTTLVQISSEHSIDF